jgi:hypothetical protein
LEVLNAYPNKSPRWIFTPMRFVKTSEFNRWQSDERLGEK